MKLKKMEDINKNVINDINNGYNIKNILNIHTMQNIYDMVCKEQRRCDIIKLLNINYAHKLVMKSIENFKLKTYPIPY